MFIDVADYKAVFTYKAGHQSYSRVYRHMYGGRIASS